MDVSLEMVDKIVDSYGSRDNMLIQILQDVQTEYNWLPREAIIRVCERLQIPVSRAYRIATFYTLFSLEPRGRHVVNVCLGTACHVRGGPRILEKVQEVTGISAGQTTPDMRYTVERVNCLGCCALGPVITVDGEAHGKLSGKDIPGILEVYE
ncbi:MAG: NAD(P)H-dependent oxidoreductase subunit E [Dehalococcoidia bacterium]